MLLVLLSRRGCIIIGVVWLLLLCCKMRILEISDDNVGSSYHSQDLQIHEELSSNDPSKLLAIALQIVVQGL